ncbi:TIGR00341 family protein [Raoultibacter phocaeensis]|uniref:TIGR00341 family protein n=1 Tax=Raoultibacter phocaeensis TaxID=2479841 RepID=UPI00111B1675|nr:TIGR00341 family protein [Raoultibacter phocaeensis]
MGRIARVLKGGHISEESILQTERSTFIVIDEPLKQYSSFFLCIVLSAIIATGGIAAESTAIVIGAMLIAPLMSPMIGTSLAITEGKPKKALKTLLIAFAGAAVVVGVAFLVTALVPAGVQITSNAEVTSRTSPRAVDLVVAIASGFVGAMAVARDDIADAIPGVAIAVSIVPPLCVVGAALYEGYMGAAAGALLLFIVNFFAIQLSGNLAFFAMGFGKRRSSETGARVRKLWYTTAILGTLLLAVPLLATSNQLVQSASEEREAKAAVRAWLEDSDYRLRGIDIDDDVLTVEIAGSGMRPSADALAAQVDKQGAGSLEVSVIVMEEYHSE